MTSVKVLWGFGVNILASVLTVLTNKWIYVNHGFPNMSLTCLHLIITSLLLHICLKASIFQFKSLPIKKMLPSSISFCACIVLANMSLQENTVVIFQLFKALTIPCIITIQSYFYGRTFGLNVKLTLIPIALGVVLNSFTNETVGYWGLAYALSGIIFTALYQVWIYEHQRELQANSLQLLYYQAPLSASLLILVIPFIEPVFGERGLLSAWSYQTMAMVLLSCLFAFLVNLSMFWVIGNTSPLSYNIMGHLKFSMVVLGGFLLMHEPMSALQVAGVLLTFIGMVTYVIVKVKDTRRIESHSGEDSAPQST